MLFFCALPAHAQFQGYTSPQTIRQFVFNAITSAKASPTGTSSLRCTPAVNGAGCPIQNIGQNFHIVTYVSTDAAAVFQLQIEGSQDGTNFFPISDAATSQTTGSVYAQGYYPVLRVNLVSFSSVTGNISVWYSGTSTGSMPPTGVLNQSQGFRKVVASNVLAGAGETYFLSPPCGSTMGTLFFQYLSGAGASGTVNIVGGADTNVLSGGAIASFSLANSTNVQPILVPSINATQVRIVTAAALGSNYSIQYVFDCPAPGGLGTSSSFVQGLLQPLSVNGTSTGSYTLNTETTSATNASAVKTITAAIGERVSLFSVSARCSAGTSGLTVADGATQIWSTAATEVGTTTFKFQWGPGLATTVGNAMTITLTTCGSGNTGTLDVQASQN